MSPNLIENEKPHRWRNGPPWRHFVKLNFDGASKGTPYNEGLGWVFKDNKGNIICLYVKNMDIYTNNVVDLQALEWGICIDVGEGYGKQIVEGDSMIIIHILGILLHGSKIKKISTGWRIERFLENLHPLIPQSEVIIPSHVLHSSIAFATSNEFSRIYPPTTTKLHPPNSTPPK